MPAPSGEFFELQSVLKGRYSLEHELGRGGMGVVYLAREVALDRPVALKVLAPELARRDDLRKRFLGEARTAARLSHPHVVPIFAVDEADPFVFFAMAFIDGETLGQRVRARGPLGHAETTRLLKEVAWALAYAHAQGVVHRDVKPDNILLEAGSGRALVTDFGIALAGGEEAEGEDGTVTGTAEFMSPEQARGERVDARADIWALGAVGFFAASGRLPFQGSTPREVLARVMTQAAPPVASVAPDLPSRLAGPIDRCLRRDPDQRWAGGGELAAALEVGVSVERPIPVPLRVFIKRLRELARSLPGVAAVLAFLPGSILVRLLASGAGAPAVVAAVALLAGVLGVPAAVLVYQARKLLKAGYRIEDVRHALVRDTERRTEELQFEHGIGHGWYDDLLKVVWMGGLAVGLVGVVAAVLFGVEAVMPIAFGFGAAAIAGLLTLGRKGRRRDLVGAGWLRILGGSVGDGLFRAGGLFLARPAAAGSATYRPTELALGMAADRLYEDLPRDVRRSLPGLPATVRKLEGDAQAMRRQVAELDGVLAEIGDDPGRAGAEERGRVRAQVEATRDRARERLTAAVSALETLRLGLLRMHAGDGDVRSVTMELEAARVISDDIDGLLEGRAEVERLLASGSTRGEGGGGAAG